MNAKRRITNAFFAVLGGGGERVIQILFLKVVGNGWGMRYKNSEITRNFILGFFLKSRHCFIGLHLVIIIITTTIHDNFDRSVSFTIKSLLPLMSILQDSLRAVWLCL